MSSQRNVVVIIPTLNASSHFERMLPALAEQGLSKDQFLFIDSSSNDDTVKMAREFGARTEIIPRKDFNHGGTRRLGCTLCRDADFLVFLTQDAIPAGAGAIANLVKSFDDASVGMAYGRQLPRQRAGAIERYARLSNYPSISTVRNLSDRSALGIKTIFCSDSFAAYRKKSLEDVGSFPEDCYFAEDQVVAGRMLTAGYKLAYVSEACVVHSHGYTVPEDFKRNFDVGVFHARNPWLLDVFGRAEGAGFRYVVSEIMYLLRVAPFCLPSALIRTLVKYAGYRIGLREASFSNGFKAHFSMQPSYWRTRQL
jgi:rhamnosyltransferase